MTAIRHTWLIIVIVAALNCSPQQYAQLKYGDDLVYFQVFGRAMIATREYCETHPSFGRFISKGIERLVQNLEARGFQIDIILRSEEELQDDEEALQYFYESFDHICEQTEMRTDELLLVATKGALDVVNPQSVLFESEIGKIGIQFLKKSKGFVAFPLIDGPGHRSGLSTGDLITAIDGISIVGISSGQFIDRVTGPTGSICVLEVSKPASDSTVVVEIVRENNYHYTTPSLITQSYGIGIEYFKPGALYKSNLDPSKIRPF
jgi:hypothetical protein